MTAVARLTADRTLWPEILRRVTYVLTVRQPWADLIVAWAKDVENRTWKPPSTVVRFDDNGDSWLADEDEQGRLWRRAPLVIAIHAAAKVDPTATGIEVSDEWEALPWYDGWVHADVMPLGAIVGTVTVTGAHHADDPACLEVYTEGEDTYGREVERFGPCSRWAESDAYHWTLTDAQPLDEPIPAKGRLGLWKLDELAVAS